MGIIVTVESFHSRDQWIDMEVDSTISLIDLIPEMTAYLQIEGDKEDQDDYILELRVNDRWKTLDDRLTFSECNVEDGAYLRVRKRLIVTSTESPFGEWHSIFPKLSNSEEETKEAEESVPKYTWKLLE